MRHSQRKRGAPDRPGLRSTAPALDPTDLSDFYHREGRLLGVDTLKLTLAESASILRQLAPGFDSGAFRPPAVETCPLAESPGAYARLHAGDVTGKLVLVP